MRRALRNTVLIVVGAVAVTAIAPATPPGRTIVSGLIENAASGNGLTVMVDGLSGWPPFGFGIERISLADAQGPFAEVDNLSAHLRLLPLLVGRIALSNLSADRVAITRQPVLQPAGGESAGIPFTVEQFSVARTEIGEAVAGHAAVLAIAGSLTAASPTRFDATVNAERVDGTIGSLTASVVRQNGESPVSASVKVSEAANGILPGLLGHSTTPAYTLTAETTVADAGLTGTLNLKSEGAAHFDGNFAYSPAGANGHRLTIAGDGNLEGFVPAAYADLLAGPVDIGIDASWQQTDAAALPAITVARGTLTSANLRVQSTGTLGGSNSNLAASINVGRPGGGAVALPLPGGSVESAQLTARVTPSADALRLEVTGQVTRLQVSNFDVPSSGLSLAVEAHGANPVAAAELPFALRLEADAIVGPTGRIDSVAGAPILLSATGTYDVARGTADTTARLSIAGSETTFAGTAGLAGTTGEIRADLPDLAPLSPLAGRPLAGSLQGSLQGALLPSMDATLDATSRDLNPGDARLARLLAGEAHVTAKLTGVADSLAVSTLALTSPGITATGSLDHPDEAIHAELSGTIADLSRLADHSSGAANFAFAIKGDASQPSVEAKVEVAHGQLLNQALENASVRFTGMPAGDTWQGILALAGNLAGKPLSGGASATLVPDTGQLSLPTIDLDLGGNRITGALDRVPEGALSGTLAIDAPNLQSLAALALVDATGSAKGTVTFTPDGARQSLTLDFTAADIVAPGGTAKAAEGHMTISDLFGTPLADGRITASDLVAGGQRLNTADITTSVANGATRFQIAASGPDIDLASLGSLAPADGGSLLRLDTLTGTAFRLPVSLASPLSIRLGVATAGAIEANLAIGGGTVAVAGRVSPALDMTVTATAVAASVVNAFSPGLAAEGNISGRATITGTSEAPAFDWQATWTGMRVAATRNAGLPGLTVSGRGKGNRSATSLDADLSGAGLSLAITGNVPFSGAGLAIDARGNAPLSLLALESSRELRLAGTARIDLTVTGSFAAPRIEGGADLSDAVIADAETGAGITGGSGHIVLSGDRATTERIAGRLTQGGDVVVSGSVSFAGAGLPADLAIRVTNGRYNDGEIVNTSFNADLTLKGPLLADGALAGRIDLARTEIQLPDKFGASRAAIDVRHVHVAPGFRAPKLRSANTPDAGGSSGGRLRLDIAMTATSAVYVRGFGVDAELGGSLKLAGTSGDPQAIGGLTMRRGRIELLGRRFDFTSGTLSFAGDLMPVLDFSGTTTVADATVTLLVTGPANDPVISFTSNPNLPEEEILSRLLFDRSVGSLSPLQAAQLVDAVAQLTGALGGTGIFARIRQATGLDDLDVRQSATGGTTVGVGKRLNDNMSLGVEAGTEANSGRVSIDLDLTNDLKARASAGQDGSGKIGLTYEHEY